MKKQKRSRRLAFVLAFMLIFSIALTACNNGAEPEKTEAPAATDAPDATEAPPATDAPDASEDPEETEDPGGSDTPDRTLKVGMVLPGTINDEGWNATAFRGLEKIKNELGFETSYSENVAVSDFTQIYRGYAEQGYDLIIGHGFEFVDPARQINEEYPDTWFATTSTNEFEPPNVFAINTNSTHAGFLNGIVAANMTKSGIVGTIGGLVIPGITGYLYGFEEGVKYVDPSITVLVTSTGSGEDVTAVKEVANSMIADGADVLAPNANQAAIGGFQAVNETKEEVWILGVYGDQRVLSPERTLVSAIVDIPEAIKLGAEMVAKGTVEATDYMFGIEEGAVYMTDYLDVVSQDTIDQVQDAIDKFKSGELVLVNPTH